MARPTTYAEWTSLLDRFSEGDDSALQELGTGTFGIDAGTAVRFYIRVEDAYKKRKQKWLDKFQLSFAIQSLKTEDDFGIALRNGKQNLLPLRKFVMLNGLPEDLNKTLKKDLEDFVLEIKKSLKNNVSKISTGREKMLILLNTFKLDETFEDTVIQSQANKKTINETFPVTGRKIIF